MTKKLIAVFLSVVLFAALIPRFVRGQAVNNGLANYVLGIDPCQSSGITKSSTFANITTATTTALVAVSGSTTVYVCGIDVDIASTATPSTVLFEQGTGVACATAPTSISATYTNGSGTTTVAESAHHLGYAGHTWIKTAASNGLCAVSTVGTGPTIGVTVTFVQL